MGYLIITIISAISGTFLWEVFKFFYPDLKKLFTAGTTAKLFLVNNLDPIIKSADELYGKIESLAGEDFATFSNKSNSISNDAIHNQKYILYLFAQFWAHIENIRLLSHYSTITYSKRGRELLKFIETLESRKYRILDRSIQRIIGECLLANRDQKFKVLTLMEFMEELKKPESMISNWIYKLELALNNVSKQEDRQRVLRYGTIVQIFIDHFDPNHKIVRKRNSLVKKFLPKSNELIREHLFRYYLPFVKRQSEYYQKKSGPLGGFSQKGLLPPLDPSVSLKKKVKIENQR